MGGPSPPPSLYAAFKFWATEQPHKPAVEFEGRTISYVELDALTLRYARHFHLLGLPAGARVLTFSPNVPEFLAIYLACSATNLVFAPVNTAFRRQELAYITANADAAVAVVHRDSYDDYRNQVEGLPSAPKHILLLGGARRDVALPVLGEAQGDARLTPPPNISDDALLIYTSGTTSRPKPVLHSHAGVVLMAKTYAEVMRCTPADRVLVALPMAWDYGLRTSSSAALVSGGAILLLSGFHPERVLEAIEASRATMFFGTMSMYTKMLDVLDRRDFDLSSLRVCANGGEPCPDSAVIPIERRIGRRLVQLFAMTECSPLLAVDPLDTDAPRSTAGRLVPGAQIRLLDDNGQPVPRGTPGEAQVTGPAIMKGYFKEPELTAHKMTADGWVRTGDLLIEDERGYFYVVGRTSDLIIRSGANISPGEIEAALLMHPTVNASAVIGVPDAISGEKIVAFIVIHEGEQITEDDLRRHLEARIARYKIPQEFRLIEALPTTVSNKLDRAALKRMALSDTVP